MTDRIRTDPTTGEVIEDPPIRPFGDWLREQSGGSTHDELSEAMWDLVKRVQETGKKGSLLLTVVVEPMKKTDGTALIVTDTIKLKLPDFDRPASVAYVDRNGNLIRNNPLQPELTGLRVVPEEGTKPTELREAK